MGGTTVLPPSLLPRRSTAVAADLRSCSSHVRLNPTLMANPADAKRPQSPMSVREGSPKPPAPKRARGACSGGELHVAPAANAKNRKLPCLSSRGELHVAQAAKFKINSNSLPHPISAKDSKSSTRLHAKVVKNQVAGSQEIAPPPSKPPVSSRSMRELIEDARLAMAAEEEARRRNDIERSRAEARRKVEQMVDTVQFNDPYIDFSDVIKSPQQLLQARQGAWRAQAQLMAMARQRDMEIANGTRRSVIQ